MNVNFKSSVGQGKSLFFGKSNDGKKTLFKKALPPPPLTWETQNLIAFWKLDNLTDSSSNANNLVNVNNVQFVAGKIGNCAEFNGNNSIWQGLRGAIALNSAQNFTISFWANPYANVNGAIISAIDSNGIIFRIRNLSNGSLRIIDGSNNNLSFTNSFTIGTWRHYVWIKAGAITKVYINGIERSNGPFAFSFTKTTTEIGIGNTPNFFQEGFAGRIDSVGIWQRELSLEEIQRLYNSGTGLEL